MDGYKNFKNQLKRKEQKIAKANDIARKVKTEDEIKASKLKKKKFDRY